MHLPLAAVVELGGGGCEGAWACYCCLGRGSLGGIGGWEPRRAYCHCCCQGAEVLAGPAAGSCTGLTAIAAVRQGEALVGPVAGGHTELATTIVINGGAWWAQQLGGTTWGLPPLMVEGRAGVTAMVAPRASAAMRGRIKMGRGITFPYEYCRSPVV